MGTGGITVVAVVGVALAAGIYARSRRQPVTAENVNDVPAAMPVGASACA
jgi:PiT family inorganic phosphate transporter